MGAPPLRGEAPFIGSTTLYRADRSRRAVFRRGIGSLDLNPKGAVIDDGQRQGTADAGPDRGRLLIASDSVPGRS
jgi:hypothetical protein